MTRYLNVRSDKNRERFMRISNSLKLLGTLGFLYYMFMMLRMVPTDIYEVKDEKDSPPNSPNFRIRSKIYDMS